MCKEGSREFTGVLPCNSTFQHLCAFLPTPLRLGSTAPCQVSRPCRKRVGQSCADLPSRLREGPGEGLIEPPHFSAA